MIHAASIYDVVAFMHINHKEDLKCSRKARARKGDGIAPPSPIILRSIVTVEQDTGNQGGKRYSRNGRVPLEWPVFSCNGKEEGDPS